MRMASRKVTVNPNGAQAAAIRLWSAVDVFTRNAGVVRAPVNQADYAAWLGTARQALGDRAFDAAWTAGQILIWQDAAEEALILPEPSEQTTSLPLIVVDDLPHEAALAAEIQAGLLPATLPHPPGWQLAAMLLPARETAGDFYDCVALPDGRLILVIADVAGKGLGAALYMATGRALIRSQIAFGVHEPAALLAGVNARLLEDTHAGLFITTFLGVLDPATGTLTYANAGHPPPFLLSGKGDMLATPLNPTGLVLGIEPGVTWREESVVLGPGARLLLYTDGVTEAQDPRGAFFETDGLLAAIDARVDTVALLARVRAAVDRFSGGAPQFDDITLLVVGREG